MSVTDKFGYWLAGLIDGEGCFAIGCHKRHDGKCCFGTQFSLSLREDDQEILQLIHRLTGIGYVGPSQENMWIWRCNAKEDIAKLIRLLDRYPLRTRKKQDYDLWRLIAWEISQRRRGDSWDFISRVKELMESNRNRYRSSHVCD